MPPVKRRYILFKIEPLLTDSTEKLAPINEGDIVNAVREVVQRLHGDFGMASILLNFYSKKYHEPTRTGVLVAKRESYKFLLTALPLVRSIRGRDVSMSILKLSGTLRGCLSSLQGFHSKMIQQYKKSLKERKAFPERPAITSTEQIDKGFQMIAKSLKE